MVGKIFKRSFIWVVSRHCRSSGLEATVIWKTLYFFPLTVYHKKQFANNFIATKMIEDFVRLPWNFRWCLTCVSFGTGSNFVRIGNCFLWFLHDPLLCLVKIPEKWCNFLKNLHLFLNGLSWYSDYSFERGPKI